MILDNVVQLIYGIPGILTYVVVFYAMWSLRKVLSNSFMFLFIMTAVVVSFFASIPLRGPLQNIVTFLNTWVYLKLQKEPFFDFYFRWLEEQPVVKSVELWERKLTWIKTNSCARCIALLLCSKYWPAVAYFRPIRYDYSVDRHFSK